MVGMADTPARPTTPLGPLHVDANLRVAGAPDLHVTPTPEQGGPVADPFTALKNTVNDLFAQNTALQAQVAQLEKDIVAVKLVMQGIDPALTTVTGKVDGLRADYDKHQHHLVAQWWPLPMLLKFAPDEQANYYVAVYWPPNKQWTSEQKGTYVSQHGGYTWTPTIAPPPGDPNTPPATPKP